MVEVMVVLVIVGIVTAYVSLNTAIRPTTALKQEAELLIHAFAVAQVEARSSGRRITWDYDNDRYWFTSHAAVATKSFPTIQKPSTQVRFDNRQALEVRNWKIGSVLVKQWPQDKTQFTKEWVLDPAFIELQAKGTSVVLGRDLAGRYSVQR